MKCVWITEWAFTSGKLIAVLYNIVVGSIQHLQPDNENTYTDIEGLDISTTGVQKLLENINPNKVMDPDELHRRVMKHITPILQAILTDWQDTRWLEKS